MGLGKTLLIVFRYNRCLLILGWSEEEQAMMRPRQNCLDVVDSSGSTS